MTKGIFNLFPGEKGHITTVVEGDSAVVFARGDMEWGHAGLISLAEDFGVDVGRVLGGGILIGEEWKRDSRTYNYGITDDALEGLLERLGKG